MKRRVAPPLVAVLLSLGAAGAWATDGAAGAPEPTFGAGTGAATGASPSAEVQPAAGSSPGASAETGASSPPEPTLSADPAPAAADPPGAPAAAAAPPEVTPVPAPVQPPRAEPLRLDPPRPSLLPLARPLWSDLTEAQRAVLKPFASNWNALPQSEKQAWLDVAKRFPRMRPETQTRVAERIAEWAALTAEERRIARANYQLAQRIAREQVASDWESYQSMTPEQRSVLGTVGNTSSNTAARHVTGRTGLARVAAQPLPRLGPILPMAIGNGATVPSRSVSPTSGPSSTTVR